MPLAGLKKEINKAKQFMSEKIGGAKGTELDDDYITMEKKIDIMDKFADDLIDKVLEFLNPGSGKVFMSSSKSIARLGGQLNKNPEGILGDSMIKHGSELGNDSHYGNALIEAGDGCKQLSGIKLTLENELKQSFFEPLLHLQNKDLKEVNFHRKKVSGRRLEYDWKKGKHKEGGSITAEDVKQAEEKFTESKELAESAMYNFLDNEAEHISQITALMKAQLEYHENCSEVLKNLISGLQSKSQKVSAGNVKVGRMPMSRSTDGDWSKPISHTSNHSNNTSNHSNNTSNQPYSLSNSSDHLDFNWNSKMKTSKSSNFPNTADMLLSMDNDLSWGNRESNVIACEVKADYAFQAENEAELSFFEDEVITVISRVDEHWLLGSIAGRGQGRIPENYVHVISGQLPT